MDEKQLPIDDIELPGSEALRRRLMEEFSQRTAAAMQHMGQSVGVAMTALGDAAFENLALQIDALGRSFRPIGQVMNIEYSDKPFLSIDEARDMVRVPLDYHQAGAFDFDTPIERHVAADARTASLSSPRQITEGRPVRAINLDGVE
jgi:hypothetical protein